MHSSDQLDLRFGLSFEDLYKRDGLARLDQTFLEHLHSANPSLGQRLVDARSSPSALARKQQSDLIVELAPHVEDFIGELFGISADLRALQAKHHSLAPIYALKRRFVQKKAISGVTKEQASLINGLAVAAELEALFNEPLTEASFVDHVSRWLDGPDAEQEHERELKIAAQYAAWAALCPAGIEKHHRGVLFRVPHKLEMTNLIPVETLQAGGAGGVATLALPEHHW
ncbi:MAG: pyridine nucleotide-disulfide oxidoreductase, partial [Bryobacteraceae bacterium]